MLLSLQDDAQEQSENLQVYLRVRPFTAAESGSREAQVTHTHTHAHRSVLQGFTIPAFSYSGCLQQRSMVPVLYSSPRSMLDVIQLKTED